VNRYVPETQDAIPSAFQQGIALAVLHLPALMAGVVELDHGQDIEGFGRHHEISDLAVEPGTGCLILVGAERREGNLAQHDLVGESLLQPEEHGLLTVGEQLETAAQLTSV
jgi:hypothetical protein